METDFVIENGILKEYTGEEDCPVIPDGVTTIGEEAFICAEITGAVIPDSVKRIEDSAFEYCDKLESIKLPEGLEYIGRNAFSGCEVLTEIDIPSGVKEIGADAFDGCENLKRVGLNEGLEVIGEEAFMFCPNLTDINFPTTLREIGEYAFAECDNLDIVNVGANVDVADSAFLGTRYDEKMSEIRRKSKIQSLSSRFGSSEVIRKKTLYAGQTVKDFIGDETVYIELESTKSGVRKAAFGSVFPVALIWMLFDGCILAGMFAGGIFAENPLMLLILLFFAVHLLPVWMWIGGIIKAAKTGREVFIVTDKKLYVKNGMNLSYVKLSAIENARADGKAKVALILKGGEKFKLNGIAYPEEFAARLNNAVSAERDGNNQA